MKRLLTSASLLMLLTALPLAGQAPVATNEEEQMLIALIKEVQAQQAQIADNQTKIDTKLAELAETIRVARIFAGRAGK